MLEERTAQADTGGARGKQTSPLTPLFAVKFFESGVGFQLLFLLACGEDSEQGLGWRVSGTRMQVGFVRGGFRNLFRCRQSGRGRPLHTRVFRTRLLGMEL